MNLSMCLVGFKVCGFSRNSSKQKIGTGLACCTSWLNCMCVCSLYLLKLHLLFLSCYFWSVMAGLGKAFLLLLLCGLSAAWPWTNAFFWNGVWYRQHLPSGWWGQLLPGDGPPSSWTMNAADAQYFEDEWNQPPPNPPQVPRWMNSRGRVRDDQPGQGSKKRGLSAVVEQDDHDPTASSSSNPGGAFEGQANAILQQLEGLLQRKARFDDRSFRSQLRRNLRRLCVREGMEAPNWLDDTGLPVDEMKRRCRRMTRGIIQQQLQREDDGPENGQPGQGSAAATPAISPMVSPRGASTPTEQVSAARMVGHILDDVLDNLRVLYPDAFSAGTSAPEATQTPPPTPEATGAEQPPPEATGAQQPRPEAAGTQAGTLPASRATPTSPTSEDAFDPRETRSEPALTPRATEYPNVAETALPGQGSTVRAGFGEVASVPQIPLGGAVAPATAVETALPEVPTEWCLSCLKFLWQRLPCLKKALQ